MSLSGDSLPPHHWAGAEAPTATFHTQRMKQLILHRGGEWVTFAPNNDSAVRLKNEDVTRLPDTTLREVLLNVDVGLQDSFSEGRGLKASWEAAMMPASPLTFSALNVNQAESGFILNNDPALAKVFRVGTLP